jgi:serine protease Do
MRRWSLALALLVLGGVGGSFVATTYLQGKPAPAAPAIPAEMTSYRDVVKKVLPAVVSIEARAKAKVHPARRRAPVDESQVPEEFRRFFQDAPQVPQKDDEGGSPQAVGFGSGFIVESDGVILTNNHVVDGADQLEIQLRDGRKFLSTDIKTDPKTDLAIVRIKAKDLPYLEMGDSDSMEVGDRVLAVGAPFGLTGTVTSGIVSAKGRNIKVNMNYPQLHYEDFIQTDAAINPGNSGGPLVNLAGQVIGVNSAIKSRTGGFQGIGLAVSSNLAKNIMLQLEKDGVVHRGYLGVQVKDVDNPELAKKLGLPDTQGVVVASAFENTPAAKAGLKDGDVIVALGGKPVKDGRALQTVVTGLPVNKPAEVTIYRDGKKQNLQVVIEEQPKEFGSVSQATTTRPAEQPEEAVTVNKLGIEVTDLTADLAESLGYRNNLKGVLVTKVNRDSVGFQAGLRRGMVIGKMDQKSVTKAKAFSDAVGTASLEKGVLLQVHTPQGVEYMLLKSAAAAATK